MIEVNSDSGKATIGADLDLIDDLLPRRRPLLPPPLLLPNGDGAGGAG